MASQKASACYLDLQVEIRYPYYEGCVQRAGELKNRPVEGCCLWQVGKGYVIFAWGGSSSITDEFQPSFKTREVITIIKSSSSASSCALPNPLSMRNVDVTMAASQNEIGNYRSIIKI